MKVINNFSNLYILIFGFILLFSENGICQLELKWSLETPAEENHKFRDVALNVAGKKLYISDSYTDVVYIYKSDHPKEPIGSFGDPSWQGWPGPYGIDISKDQKVYISVMLIEDQHSNRVDDFSLWRCTPGGKNLRRVCDLPESPRGIKVVGSGPNTIVYVSGNSGSIIRCKPVKYPFEFESEILFKVEVRNQQDVLATSEADIVFTSYWSSTAPFGSPVSKWNRVNGFWQLDENFEISEPLQGNYPGIDFNREQDWLYIFFVGFRGNNSRLYKVYPESGIESYSLAVAPPAIPGDGSTGAGGIDVTRKGNIYFAGSFGLKNGFFISRYGMVRDLNSNRSDEDKVFENVDNNHHQNDLKTFYLSQNLPNPFNPSTVINYQLPMHTYVELKIYNLAGQKVATLISESKSAGNHIVEWDASEFSSGVYYYQLVADEFQEVKKMILLR